MDRIDSGPRRQSRSAGGSSGRVPPHNLSAEESVLGAILLSRDALGSVIEQGLRYDDFYKPGHQHIYDAACAVSQSGGPADTITVADELERLGLLEQVGGVEALHSLQNATPAISNAGHYAQIVQDAAMLRRLIMVAGDISELAYSRPENVDEALDEAETKVFKVADRRVTDSYVEIGELMKGAIERIEENFARGDTITGVATGYSDLDELLSGLQPSTLNIVGARPAMGKAQPLDTPLPTPTGWTTMGDIEPGDTIFDERGAPCTVTYATPVQHGRQCFEIAFDDGSLVVADAEHQWFTLDCGAWSSRNRHSGSRGGRVLTTQQMIDEGVRQLPDHRPNWYIPLALPLDLPEAELSTDPYHLGFRLGAGPDGLSNGIPDRYLRASAKQRLALLQGLMDAAGRCRPGRAEVELWLPNEALVRQVHELVCSIGHKAYSVRTRSIRAIDGDGLVTSFGFRWTPLDPVFRTVELLDSFRSDTDRDSRSATYRAIVSITPVSSVPVRCVTVDSPNHLYLTGRTMVPTHNTAFGLGMATHIAKTTNRPVLVFSLEMGHVELTQRILSSESEVDSQKIRNGRLSESDWAKIGRAIGRLEVPLYLDDNPRVTVMEIRAKARRLKMQRGDLALIVIDYLQLMSGGGHAENRQLEVSEISRNLKILARELEVPIVALSQLSRNLESRSDKRPMLSDLRESGCLVASTRLLRADNNAEVTLGELVASGTRDVPVWSLDEHYRMVPSTLTHAFPSGVKPVFAMHLASGRRIDATANHRFRTVDGWVSLDQLSVGSRIAVPRELAAPECVAPMDPDEIVLLAHLIGDGCVLPTQPVHYTSADLANLDAVEEAASRRFGIAPRRVQHENWWHSYLPAPYHLTHGRRNPIAQWWEGLGLHDCRSWGKFIPDAVFALSREQLATFLRHLWATDGSLSFRESGPRIGLYYASTSRMLVDGIQQLLLRFEIQSRISVVQKRGYRPGFHLRVDGVDHQKRFLTEIGIHGDRGERVPRALEFLEGVIANPNVDTIPFAVRRRIVDALHAAGMTHREFAAAIDEDYCGSYLLGYEGRPRESSRGRLGRMAAVLDDKKLAELAASDVLWDRVVGVEPLGEQPVFDATVLATHNFIANGIVAHNSLEQDSDVVMFLYRDEVYNKESTERGAADVIIAKHRAGPIGDLRLVFRGQYTRFDNAAPRSIGP